jgi:serine/threonine protein kinase, bacterial
MPVPLPSALCPACLCPAHTPAHTQGQATPPTPGLSRAGPACLPGRCPTRHALRTQHLHVTLSGDQPTRLASVTSVTMSEPDDTELAAGIDDGAADTAVVSDNSVTEAAQLAWSTADTAPDVTRATERQPLSLALRILLICVAVGAATLMAFFLGHGALPGSLPHAPAPNAAPAAEPPQPAPAAALTVSAQSAAESIRAAIPEVTETIALTADNDANNLIGRPNGYVAATVLVDSRARCPSDGPGVDCGATIEQWPSAEAAQRRAEYIQGIGHHLPMMSEWTTVKGNLLLRVVGKLKPSAAETYKAAFTA